MHLAFAGLCNGVISESIHSNSSDQARIGGGKEGSVLFNDALNTFHLRLYGVRHMVKDHSDSKRGNMGYSFRLTARVLLYAPSYRQDNTYHVLC